MAFPNLVIDYHRLDTKFFAGHVQHTTFHSDASQGRRRVKEVKNWYRKREIGRGSFGTVFLEGSEGGEYRAVKEIAKDKGSRVKIDYRGELMAMAILGKHDALFVQLFGWYENDDYVHIAMEYLSHGHLRNYLEVERSEIEAKVITRQLLEGLVVIHQEGFAHRDLKPENIFVVSVSPIWVKIGDFGLAKLARDGTAFRTEGGTRDYVAPEVGVDTSRETSEYTNAVDIWAIGCIVHEMLTRVLPFQNFRELSLYCTYPEFPRNYMLLKNISWEGMETVESMLALPPECRITAKEALDSEWLRLEDEGQGGLETEGLAGPALLEVPAPSGVEAAKPRDEVYQFHEFIGPSGRYQVPTSASPVVRKEGGSIDRFISSHTNVESVGGDALMAVTSRQQARYLAVNGLYSSQGSGVSAAGGETKDTAPPRPAADSTRDLSFMEISHLPDCPMGSYVSWGSWFQAPDLPDFNVCSRCYYTHIHRSPFRFGFSPAVDRPDGIALSCGFYTPRILQLWETALRGRNFESFLRYVEARTRIPHCNKLEPHTGGRWWVVPGDMPNFQVCEACYNDLVLASPFANRLASHPAPQDEMYCSLGIPGLQKRFLRLIETRSPAHGNTWQDFVRSANYRITVVPKCAGAAYIHDPRDWWTCKKAIQGFGICEACYLDEVEPSLWHDKFVPIPNKQSRSGKWGCDFAIIPVKLSWQLALNDAAREFDDFWKCAEAALSMPSCRGQTINGGEWFRMLNTSNFSVCPTCYYTLIRALGFGDFFHREQHTKGSLSWCDLSPESPGYHALLTKLGEALDCRDFSRFEAYAHARSLAPLCPGSDAVTGRKWYGTESFAACERCYKDIIEPSLLASQLTIHGATFTDAVTCDIYSPRMRAIWAQACEMGNLDHFSAAAKHRAEVYFRTKAAMRTINETIGSQLELKCSLLANAATLNSIALTARSVRGHSTYSYGNLEVGYGYGSPEEVEAAALRRRAEAIGNGDPSLLQQLHELEQEWEAVE